MCSGLRAALLAAVLLFTTSAAADDITFFFTGHITSAEGPSPPFAVNDTFSGSYTFNSLAADSNVSATVGDYFHSTSPYGMTINIGGYTISTSVGSNNFLVEVTDNHSGADAYVVLSFSNSVSGPPGLSVSLAGFQLTDSTQAVFSSTDLPLTPPDLSAFNINLFTLMGTVLVENGPGPTGELNWSATGVLDTLTLAQNGTTSVPEPSSLLLLGSALLAVAGVRRRIR